MSCLSLSSIGARLKRVILARFNFIKKIDHVVIGCHPVDLDKRNKFRIRTKAFDEELPEFFELHTLQFRIVPDIPIKS